VPAHRRPLGMVFQEANLFPHLSVRRNMEFGQQRVPASERRFTLPDVGELLGIGHLLERMPVGLSGGERQRVAIARALLASPRYFCWTNRWPGSTFSANSRSCPTWNACTATCGYRSSTSATPPTRSPA
jgi:ABC-type uncharacterized transport system YnjBCD ATPase subunit